MIIPASNDFLVKVFNQLSSLKVNTVSDRKVYDYSRYSMLEFVSFDSSNKKYVLKTVRRPLKNEIIIHKFVNDFTINGAKFIAGYSSDFFNLYFIVMEYIDNLTPVYNFEDGDVIEDYAELVTNLASFHVEASKKVRKIQIDDFKYEYYNKLLFKFNEKLPVLGKAINHELYLTPDIMERFDQNTDLIQKQLLKIKPLKRTLVHGDFDIGNIFFKVTKNNRKITAIDWGLSHIDAPIIDIANLLNSLENLSDDARNYILDSYLKVAHKKFPRNFSLDNFQSIGMVLHRLFFIDYQLNTLETSTTSVEEYYEQIHTAMQSLCSLVKDLD